MTPEALVAQLRLDPVAASAALARPGSADAGPWYVRALLALGAIFSAVSALGFLLAIVEGLLDETFWVPRAIVGLGVFGFGLRLRRAAIDFGFRAVLALSITVAGAAYGIYGLPHQWDIWYAHAIAALALAAVATLATRDKLMETVGAAAALATTCLMLLSKDPAHAAIVLPLIGLGGAWLLLRPPGRWLPAAGTLALVASGVAAAAIEHLPDAARPGGAAHWIGQGVALGTALLVVWQALRAGALGLAAAAALGLAASLTLALLPAGGLPLLSLLAIGWLLGHRGLASLGSLAALGWVGLFYYDLRITLLDKSIALAVIGLALLIAWWWRWRRSPA